MIAGAGPVGDLVGLEGALGRLDRGSARPIVGRVTEVTGLVLRATVPGARVGELLVIEPADSVRSPLPAEVVGFRGDEVVLVPLGSVHGIGPDAVAVRTQRPLAIKVGEALLGRVLDGLGQPVDGLAMPAGLEDWAVDRASPDPLRRPRISRPLCLGIRAIDGLLTVGEGQRIGLFAGPGVGKSTLMGQIARQTEADVNVICLVGERGRELNDFIEQSLGARGRARSVIVCATSDVPSLVRLKSTFVATAVAEWFRDRGARVLLMMDSLSRLARAQREVGLAAGEPPSRQGYPPSVFALLPRLLERAGNSARGSITAIYTVLVAGGDLEEPVADEVRGILDGHIVLAPELAARNHWPAIDVPRSLSRVMDAVADTQHRAAAAQVRELMATYERQRDLISLGLYQRGSHRRTDEAMDRIEAIEAFLRQDTTEATGFDEMRRRLLALVQ